MNSLAGKRALISGAARGIGAQTARRMAEAGAKVIVGDILEARAQETVSEITAAGGTAHFVPLDVTREQDWTKAVGEAETRYGGLDILVNNAGLFLGREFDKATDDDWDKIVAINLKGV